MDRLVVVEPKVEGGYSAYVPSLPGCVREGSTRDEVLTKITEAIQLHFLSEQSTDPWRDETAAAYSPESHPALAHPILPNCVNGVNSELGVQSRILCGDARHLLAMVEPETVALSFWSPPYFVGKSYERQFDI